MKNSNENIGNRTRDVPACSAVPRERVVTANYIRMCRYKAKIQMLHKLHGKMFETWNRLHVTTIIIIDQMQTNIYVSSNPPCCSGFVPAWT